MNERAIGILLCTFSAFLILFETWTMFFAPSSLTDPFFLKPLSWWSIALPVYVIVLAFFGILIWIGWAMVKTAESPESPGKSEESDAKA